MMHAGLQIIWDSDINRDFFFDSLYDIITPVYLAMIEERARNTKSINQAASERSDEQEP